ncbi:MAG: preprotein translocase subunit SecA [Candidatus Pacebacteria bacterium]|nr:preprotein translocase subunit SecA [Candidatus Paceibacterota bacterium]
MAILQKIFGDENQKYLKRAQKKVEEINRLEPVFEKLKDKEIKEKTQEFKERIKKGESLDNVLCEAFALVREASKRTLKQRHYDVQLIGGMVLHEGKIAQMLTGEGKTLAATLPAYLNALEGKGVHIVTVNDYLAKRDTVWMGQIYHLLGLSVGCIIHEQFFLYDPEYKKEEEEKRDQIRDTMGGFKVVESYLRPVSRKEAYLADITYGTNHEFGFDYLRDNMAYHKDQRVQRGLNFAIIDEVDFILIDEARTPLIISAPDVEGSKMYKEFAKIVPLLKPEIDYEVHEKEKAVTLTEAGIEKIEKILGVENIYQEKGIRYLHHLEQALRAEVLFKRDRDYVVKNGEVIIVDEFTGRLMPGRRWSGGLHQAIEAKEGLEIRPESITLASISFQNYFLMYKKLAGMTGTAKTSEEEFRKVYGLEVIVVPTNKPMIRKDLPDVVFKTEKEKLRAVVGKIKECYKRGQPILVGTRSIEKNEYLGKLLEREGIPHQILNAKNHQKEGEIIAQAGRLKAVTVATNMAGRGVDIILGGNPPDPKEAKKVKELGGLFVLGTERHEARRIDDQLRGRAGRQGDSGVSQFFLCLEDELLRVFGGERAKNLMEKLKIPEGQPIKSKLVSHLIESAQKRIEGFNFDLRKHLLEYDTVMNIHRQTFYRKRREILEAEKDQLKEKIKEICRKERLSFEKIEKKEKEFEKDNFWEIVRFLSLRIMDNFWVNHLEEMEYLKDKVRLKAYGQIDPLVEYKNEGYKIFKNLLTMIDRAILQSILGLSKKEGEGLKPRKEKVFVQRVEGAKKVGRNDPCPCGSGKKYKKCCWPKYG